MSNKYDENQLKDMFAATRLLFNLQKQTNRENYFPLRKLARIAYEKLHKPEEQAEHTLKQKKELLAGYERKLLVAYNPLFTGILEKKVEDGKTSCRVRPSLYELLENFFEKGEVPKDSAESIKIVAPYRGSAIAMRDVLKEHNLNVEFSFLPEGDIIEMIRNQGENNG